MRLRSDFWVAAYIRRCNGEGVSAALRRRGAAEAGTIFIKLDQLDGSADLFGIALPSFYETLETALDRCFEQLIKQGNPADIEARMQREMRYDPDLWFIEIEDRSGRHFLDLV
jgi:hypothetical protein